MQINFVLHFQKEDKVFFFVGLIKVEPIFFFSGRAYPSQKMMKKRKPQFLVGFRLIISFFFSSFSLSNFLFHFKIINVVRIYVRLDKKKTNNDTIIQIYKQSGLKIVNNQPFLIGPFFLVWTRSEKISVLNLSQS